MKAMIFFLLLLVLVAFGGGFITARSIPLHAKPTPVSEVQVSELQEIARLGFEGLSTKKLEILVNLADWQVVGQPISMPDPIYWPIVRGLARAELIRRSERSITGDR